MKHRDGGNFENAYEVFAHKNSLGFCVRFFACSSYFQCVLAVPSAGVPDFTLITVD